MLTSEEEQRLVQIHHRLQNHMEVRLVLTDDERSADFQTYCGRLTALLPKLRIKQKKEAGSAPPAIVIGQSTVFHALPHGTELPPFLDLLVAQSVPAAESSPTSDVHVFEAPAMFKLFVSPMCPFCPLVLKNLLAASTSSPTFQLTVIDVVLFPEMAQTGRIKSVPTLVLDDAIRWTGAVNMTEVYQTARQRDPSKLSAASLKSMILNGDAFRLVEMMVRQQRLFPAFIDLLTHEEFSTRLGAMAAAENLAENDGAIALGLIEPLRKRFEQAMDTVKGDILYTMGKAGDLRSIPFLKRVAAGPYADDVKEAALEAVQDIHNRTTPG